MFWFFVILKVFILCPTDKTTKLIILNLTNFLSLVNLFSYLCSTQRSQAGLSLKDFVSGESLMYII